MTNKEKLTRLVLEALHGCSCKEALEIEQVDAPHPWWTHHPITLGRIIKALSKKENESGYLKIEVAGYEEIYLRFYSCGKIQIMCNDGELDIIQWQQNTLGTETIDDQPPETIEQLLKLFG